MAADSRFNCYYCNQHCQVDSSDTMKLVEGWIGRGRVAMKIVSQPKALAHRWCVDGAREEARRDNTGKLF